MKLVHVAAEALSLPIQVLFPERFQRWLRIATLGDLRRNTALKHAQGRLLDIGCGENKLAREYRTHGGLAYGVDTYEWPDLDLKADAAALPFADNSFDTVTVVAALNHIVRRQECMDEIARVVRPRGKVLVTMIPPLVGSLAHRILWWDADIRSRHMGPEERHGMHKSELTELARLSGLRYIGRERFVLGLNSLYVFEK